MSSKSSQNDRPAYTEPPAPHPRNPASVAPWLKNPYSELPRPLPPPPPGRSWPSWRVERRKWISQ